MTTSKEHEDQVNLNDLLIQELCKDIKEPIKPITHEELAEDILLPYVTTIINKIIEIGALPEHLKEGVLTPVLKKGKDQRKPSNYRGITVTTTLSKILEHTLQERLNALLDPTQSKRQRGFTFKTSPLNAAFMVSKAIAEKTDNKENVALVTLDAEKAFDRVWHERLFNKIYQDGIQGTLWLLLRDMQANATSRVKWENALSNPFKTLQGIRQGAKLSTTLYKRYNNSVLQQIEDNNLGTTIGTINVGAPTVADDISMLPSTPLDTQVMLHTVSHNAELDKVSFNATKSELIIYGSHRDAEPSVWKLGTDEIISSTSTTHLGLVRQNNSKFNVEPKVQVARKTMYSLLGAGLHGRRGLNPLTSYHLWECFGLPRCTYGLECVRLTGKDIETMEKFQRSLLTQLQSLPDRCANIPVYTLVGAKPISVVLDIKILNFFISIARQTDSKENQIIRRQLAVKDENSISFTTTVRKTLQKYHLPDAYSLTDETPTKSQWKKMVKEATNTTYTAKITEEVRTKSTLKYLGIQKDPLDNPHPIYKFIGSNPFEVQKAEIKARMLTGTYILKENMHKFNQHDVDNTCELCLAEPEDRCHFVLKCIMLENTRQRHINNLIEVVPALHKDPALLLQCILDQSHDDLVGIVPTDKDTQSLIEQLTRNMLYDLHKARSRYLKTDSL